MNRFSQIINSIKKEYQNAIKNLNEIKNKNSKLKKELERHKYYYRNEIKNQKDAMRRKKMKRENEILDTELKKKQSIIKRKEHKKRKIAYKEYEDEIIYNSEDEKSTDNEDHDAKMKVIMIKKLITKK